MVLREIAGREGERKADIVAKVDLVAGLDAAVEAEDPLTCLIFDFELDGRCAVAKRGVTS